MAQRQPTDAQIDAAKRILAHDHKRTYAMHSKGATIRAIQIYLASHGYEPGRFDGDWGEKTQAAWDALKADRGWTYTRATPKALADISKEMGQPLPRARPKDAGQFIGGHGEVPETPPTAAPQAGQPSFRDFATNPGLLPPDATSLPMAAVGEAGGKFGEGASATMPMEPVAQPDTTSPDQFGPDLLSLERGAYNPLAAEATPPPIEHGQWSPAPDVQPNPAHSPSMFGSLGDATGAMYGEPSGLGANIDAAAGQAPQGFEASRFDAAPMTSDTGVPDQLIEAAKARQPGGPMTLREALLYPGSNMLPSSGYMSPQQELGGAVQQFGTELVGAPRDMLRRALMAGR